MSVLVCERASCTYVLISESFRVSVCHRSVILFLKSFLFSYIMTFYHPIKHFLCKGEQRERKKHISPMENKMISRSNGCHSRAFYTGSILSSSCRPVGQLRDAKDVAHIF